MTSSFVTAIVYTPPTVFACFAALLQRAIAVLPNAQKLREPSEKHEFFVTSGYAISA
jgi:hypothetical protein